MLHVQINVMSEVVFVRLISLPDCQKLSSTCSLFWGSGQTDVWTLKIWIRAALCMYRKCDPLYSFEDKHCTVNISALPLGPHRALIMQFLRSPHVWLKFKTLKWGIIEGMSLMVHSLSVQWQLLLLKALQEQLEGFPWCWTRAAAFMFMAQWERVVC